uniref:Uncharacterized protein n=1 Tax=Strigamia maritima TaxID=126957 RepID=T1JET7_STRMM
MALRGLPTALNNVNVSKKLNEKSLGVTRRAALGDIANTRNAASGIANVKKIASKVEPSKPQRSLKPPMKIVKPTEALTDQFDKLEVKESYSVQQISVIENIDAGDENEPHLVSEWVNEIYDYLRELEDKLVIRPAYLRNNAEIRPRMRAVLVDWLTQVHTRFGMLPETLYLSVAIMDRILQDLEVCRLKLQLVGITSMFIAAKYEEMFAPELDDLIYICDNAYTKTEIRQMECVILQQLDFSLGRPLPLHFLRRNSKAGKANSLIHTMAKYLMELTLVQYDMVHHRPSLIAAAALCLSLKLLRDSSWNDTLIHHSKYTEKELMPVMEKLALISVEAESSPYQTVRLKYASEKFGRISTSKCLQSSTFKCFAEAAKSARA